MRETGAQGVLTTDKDAVRLRVLRPLPVPVAAVPLTVAIDPAAAPAIDPAAAPFEPWLLARLREIRT